MILALAATLIPSSSATAYWGSLPGSGVGAAATGVLAPPAGVTVPVTSGRDVPVGWSASPGPLDPDGYYVTRTADGTTDAACDTSPTVLLPAGQCTDSVASGSGPFQYRVTAIYRSWTATASAPVTVTIVAEPREATGGGPDLGAAAGFSALGSAVTSGGITLIEGDVGSSPAAALTLSPTTEVSGELHPGDPAAEAARMALDAAFADAGARDATANFAGDQNGATFGPGVHRTDAAFLLTGDLVLDADGDPDAIFILQVNAAVSPSAGSRVLLAGGAQASNVYWWVNGAVSTGAGSTMVGTLLVVGAITIGANGTLTGRALATGEITLTDNVIRFTDVP